MATNPLGPLYQHLHRVLDEQRVHEQDILREAGADVYVETDDGGAATVVHDPAQTSFETQLVTTDDSAVLAALTNAIETEPWRFAERFLMLERAHALLSAEVDTIRETVHRLSYWSA